MRRKFLQYMGLGLVGTLLGAGGCAPSLVSQTTGTDYSELDRALSNRQWQEADQLTTRIIVYVVNRMNRWRAEWLHQDHIKQFPSEDLKLIDRLWVKHSNGTLGFSVQKRIWQECGSPGPDYYANKAAWLEFGRRVNWQGGTSYDQWRKYSELGFSNPQKYPGHLPTLEDGYVAPLEIATPPDQSPP